MKKIIGRSDKADFPDLGLQGIAVKIDTGAYTSSIHCDKIHEEDGKLVCSFLDDEHPNYNHKTFVFDQFDTANVKSSNGVKQKRYKIVSKIKIMGKIYKIYLTLSDRKEMRFPVLIGRKFLKNKFIVDTALTDVSFNAHKI